MTRSVYTHAQWMPRVGREPTDEEKTRGIRASRQADGKAKQRAKIGEPLLTYVLLHTPFPQEPTWKLLTGHPILVDGDVV